MTKQTIPRSVGTHDGTFHADEVTACALLIHFDLVDADKVVRSRDMKLLEQCEYLCDVGGVYNPQKKLFDHHQAEYRDVLSSAGMVLQYLKDVNIMKAQEYDFFNNVLILGVDAHDNGRAPQLLGVATYSHIISNFTPAMRDAEASVQNAAFKEALEFSRGHLGRLWNRYQYMQSCSQIVSEAMQKSDECLLFECNIPWLELFFELGGGHHPAKFIIMPSNKQWKLQAIPPSLQDRMNVRCPLPLEWAGLLGKELKTVSGIPGAVFCHKGRFISVWENLQDALAALKYTLKNKRGPQ